MTSPVDTSVKWARSTMPGAPILNGTNGSLVSLLDALLVNGWGTQNATSVVVSGGVATATFPLDHAAALHSVVLVSGATSKTGLNGEQKITSAVSNVIKWATAESDGIASGTIAVKMAAAGFAKSFAGTNLAAYKSLSPQAHGQFLRVNDASGAVARAVGYENMTAISTGTGLFPTAAQLSGGQYWAKSRETTSTAAPWLFASDGRFFYLLVQSSVPGQSDAYSAAVVMAFGDMVPRAPAGDPYATVVMGAPDATPLGWGTHYFFNYNGSDLTVAAPRLFGGAGTATRGICMNRNSDTGAVLPNPIDGTLPLSPVEYRDPPLSNFVRADMPGLLYCPAPGVERFVPANTIGRMEGGRAFVWAHGGQSVDGVASAFQGVALDITGPWR